MANAPCFSEGVAIAGRYRSEAGFGIHLNLTEFKPLSDPALLQSLGMLNRDGCFSGCIRELKGTPELKLACFSELKAQISKVESFGVKISHFDSHHHIHTISWMLPVIHQLQQQHGVWKMRTTMNVYGRRLHQQPPLRRVLAKKAWVAMCRLRGSRMTEVFTGLDVFLEDPSRREFQNAASIELMCHPGQQGYGEDLALLERCGGVLRRSSLQLCSFNQL